MMQEIILGSIHTYSTLSGYIYLRIPKHICKTFNIVPKTTFLVIYSDGAAVFKQVIAERKENAS